MRTLPCQQRHNLITLVTTVTSENLPYYFIKVLMRLAAGCSKKKMMRTLHCKERHNLITLVTTGNSDNLPYSLIKVLMRLAAECGKKPKNDEDFTLPGKAEPYYLSNNRHL